MNKALKELILNNKIKTSALNGWYNVGPEFAKVLLTMNVRNYRAINGNRVRKLAAEMKSGKWKKNGEAIVFTTEGILGNGQHRLEAIVLSGVTICVYLIFDAEPTDLFDVGAVRTVLTMFKAEGTSINYLDIAIGKLVLERGSGKEEFGTAYVHDFIDERMKTIKTVESIISTKSQRNSCGKKAACGSVVYCMLKNKEISETEMREFFSILNSGNTPGCSKEASSALVLRNQMLEFGRSGGRAKQKMELEITYKALRDFKLGNVRKRFYDCNVDDAERLIKDTYANEFSAKDVA